MARATRAEIDALRDAAAKAKAEADTALAQAKAALAAAQRYAQTVEEKATQATARFADIITAAEGASSGAEEVSELRDQTVSRAKVIEDFATNVAELKKELELRRTEIAQAKKEAANLHKTVEMALPGATSAGLAQAFQVRKDSYRTPKLIWALVFVLTTVALVGLALWNPLGAENQIGDWRDFLGHLLARLPFAAPLVWLGIYASARHGQALRLEEEYAHKEAISRSFEGYKKQLLELEAQSEDLRGTIELVNSVIAALSLHPGRVYDGDKDPLSPLDAVTKRLDKLIETATSRAKFASESTSAD